MFIKNKNLLLVLFVLLFSLKTKAQTATPSVFQPKWAAILNIGHQEDAINISFGTLQTIHKVSIRPNISVGIERTWFNRTKFRLFQDLKVAYFHDTYIEKVYGLSTDLGFEFKIFRGLRLTPRLGVGYNLAKPNDIRYKLEGDKWVRTANTDPSVSRLNIKAGIDLSYRFNNKMDVVVGGRYALISPYLPDIQEVFLYRGLHIGGRYFF